MNDVGLGFEAGRRGTVHEKRRQGAKTQKISKRASRLRIEEGFY